MKLLDAGDHDARDVGGEERANLAPGRGGEAVAAVRRADAVEHMGRQQAATPNRPPSNLSLTPPCLHERYLHSSY